MTENVGNFLVIDILGVQLGVQSGFSQLIRLVLIRRSHCDGEFEGKRLDNRRTVYAVPEATSSLAHSLGG